MKTYKITELKGQALRKATKEAKKELSEAFHFDLDTVGITREMADLYGMRFTEDGQMAL